MEPGTSAGNAKLYQLPKLPQLDRWQVHVDARLLSTDKNLALL